MKQIKVKHPAMFNGRKHSELAYVYAEEDGVRFNVAPVIEGEENNLNVEGCAGVLVDWEADKDYSALYYATETKTLNPQQI